jgi:hypothetical protein
MSQLIDLSLLRPNPYQSKVRATGYDEEHVCPTYHRHHPRLLTNIVAGC